MLIFEMALICKFYFRHIYVEKMSSNSFLGPILTKGKHDKVVFPKEDAHMPYFSARAIIGCIPWEQGTNVSIIIVCIHGSRVLM